MDISIKSVPMTASQVPDGQLFFGLVGMGRLGIYIKIPNSDGPGRSAIWPIENGRICPKGRQFPSPDCKVTNYEPINFVIDR